jgi:hypothetical protein
MTTVTNTRALFEQPPDAREDERGISMSWLIGQRDDPGEKWDVYAVLNCHHHTARPNFLAGTNCPARYSATLDIESKRDAPHASRRGRTARRGAGVGSRYAGIGRRPRRPARRVLMGSRNARRPTRL